MQNTKTHGDFTPRHGSVMHISAAERERLEAWSALSIAVNRLRTRPVPTLTLKQLKQRPALLEEAQKVLDTTTDIKALQDMTKKIKNFK